MEISVTPSSTSPFHSSSMPCCARPVLRFQSKGSELTGRFHPFSINPRPQVLRCNFSRVRVTVPKKLSFLPIKSGSMHEVRRCKSNLESLFCYDKSFPEEDIEQPVGLSLDKKKIGENPPCTACEIKGATLCATCEGSGLYIDSILESQGIIVKVRCLGCGGTGNIMCLRCGGRGHIGK